MPQAGESGTKGLYKNHNRGCRNRSRKATACACPWYAKYKGIRQGLARWADQEVDPHTKGQAEKVLTRFKAAIDAGTYSADGEHRSLGSGQRFADFVLEWQTHYADECGLTSNSLAPMLGVLTRRWGDCTLEYLAGASVEIERWLNHMRQTRKWTANTWNRYYELLSTLFRRAQRWKTNDVPRMHTNPLESIERRVGTKRVYMNQRLEEDVEDRLVALCDKLNRPQHRPHSTRLTWGRVEEIRGAVASGERQKEVAARFGISTGLCCQIIKRQVWAPEKYRVGTKGDEMRLRVLTAFGTGLRTSEMLRVQLQHIDFRPVRVAIDVVDEQGVVRRQDRDVLTITLPPAITKGGKVVGEVEYVYVGSPRLRQLLQERRFQLGRRPDAYVFGTTDGRQVKGFRRMWNELFDLAELEWGRERGIVWHTLRHEFVSRTLEHSDGDPVIAQQMARHRDIRTTQAYLHPRQRRVLMTAARVGHRS